MHPKDEHMAILGRAVVENWNPNLHDECPACGAWNSTWSPGLDHDKDCPLKLALDQDREDTDART